MEKKSQKNKNDKLTNDTFSKQWKYNQINYTRSKLVITFCSLFEGEAANTTMISARIII